MLQFCQLRPPFARRIHQYRVLNIIGRSLRLFLHCYLREDIVSSRRQQCLTPWSRCVQKISRLVAKLTAILLLPDAACLAGLGYASRGTAAQELYILNAYAADPQLRSRLIPGSRRSLSQRPSKLARCHAKSCCFLHMVSPAVSVGPDTGLFPLGRVWVF